jgi:hypothetical protein
MRIDPGPTHGWHVVELRETSGRPELRNIVLGTTEPVLFDWLNVGAIGLKSEMKRDMATGIEENTLNLTVNNSSYYWPTKGQDGPHHVKVSGNSDVVHGWGLAQDLPDQPAMGDDNRYQTLIVVWEYGTSGSMPAEPPPMVTPPTQPSEPVTLVNITVLVPEHMSGTFANLAAQATALARRAQ